MVAGGTAGSSLKGKGAMGMGNLWTKSDFTVQKDSSYFKTFNGSGVMGPTIGGLLASGSSASTSGLKNGKAKVLLDPTLLTVFASNSSYNNVNSTGLGTSTPSLSSGVSR